MLMPKTTWTGLADGSITVAFRRWKRPTVKAGGTLRTAAGLLAIDAVDRIDEADITEADARSAGHGSVADVLAALQDGPDRTLYRITFHHAGTDPRVALRDDAELTADDTSFVWPSLVQRNTAQGGGDAVAGRQ